MSMIKRAGMKQYKTEVREEKIGHYEEVLHATRSIIGTSLDVKRRRAYFNVQQAGFFNTVLYVIIIQSNKALLPI